MSAISDNRIDSVRVIADHCIPTNNRVLNSRTIPDHRTIHDNTAAHHRICADARTDADATSAINRCRRIHERGCEDQCRPRWSGNRGRWRFAGDEIATSLRKRKRIAEVEPVCIFDPREHRSAGRKQFGERLAFNRHHASGRNRINNASRENVTARVDLMSHDVFRSLRLLKERKDAAICIRRYQSERSWIIDIDEMQCYVRNTFAMLRNLRGHVMPAEDVAIQDQHRIIRSRSEFCEHIPDCATGTEWLGLGDAHEFNPECRSVAEILCKDLGFVGGPKNHAGDPGFTESGDLMLGARSPRDRQHRLRGVDRQWTQSGPLTTDEQNRFKHGASLAHSLGSMGALSVSRRHASAAHRNQPFVTWISGEGRTEFTGALFDQWVAKTTNYLEAEFGRELQLNMRLRAHWLWPVMVAALDELEGTFVPLDRADLVMCEGFIDIDGVDVLAVHNHPMALPFREPLPSHHHDFFLEVRAGADVRQPGPPHSTPLIDDGTRLLDAAALATLLPAQPAGARIGVVADAVFVDDPNAIAMLSALPWTSTASLVIAEHEQQLAGEKVTTTLELPHR